MIANKIDRYSTNLDCVEMRDGAKFSERYALRFFETSAVRLPSKSAYTCAEQKITNMSYKNRPYSCTCSVFSSLQKEGTDVDMPFNYLADMFYQSYERHLAAARGESSTTSKDY